MQVDEIMERARKKLSHICKVCALCNGYECSGEVPGIGGIDSGKSFINNFFALEKYQLNLRTMHQAVSPQTEQVLFGERVLTPILPAPISEMEKNFGGIVSESYYTSSIAKGSSLAGTIPTFGDGEGKQVYEAGLNAMKDEIGYGICFIKPRSVEEIIVRIRQAEEAGALAIGIDVDAALFSMGEIGIPVGPKSFYQMRRLVQSTSLPFIIKGVMTRQEGEMAAEMGAAAIVVSNHGGRVLDHTPGTAEVLPEIAEKVKGEIIVMVDGGIRTGLDVLKMLALGADYALLGRPILKSVFGGGSEGVKTYIEKLSTELKQTMILTGCAHVKAIDERVIF